MATKEKSLRVIGGKLRGRKLASVSGVMTRPTANRVREALFNILAQKPIDAAVLDLYAGTGALGIEALSRGARLAVFVDNGRQALTVLRKNIQHCRLETCTQVIRWNILINLGCLSAHPPPFDLVFIDPPYHSDMIRPTLAHLLNSGVLAPDAFVVVEHDPAETIEITTGSLSAVDCRRYGPTQLSFFIHRL